MPSGNSNEQHKIQTNRPGKDEQIMIIGDRLRALREQKNLSQGEIEKRSGLLRCYISRVENGHTVPAFETIEKFARALEVPLYQLFYDGDEPPPMPRVFKRKSAGDIVWGSTGKEARLLEKFRQLLSRADENDLKLLLFMAQKMARGKAHAVAAGD
jgi:transcriptional regulator with XRE-family HTH domain